MKQSKVYLLITALGLLLILAACGIDFNPQPAGLTPIPTLSGPGAVTLVPQLVETGAAGGISETAGGPAQGDAGTGAALFERNCSICHGTQGEGVNGPPLRNSTFVQSGPDQNIFNTIANGRPGTIMPGWLQANGGPLDGQQIYSVVAYLHKLQGVPDIPRSTPLPPEPTEAPPPANGPTPEPAQPSVGGNPGPAAGMQGDVKKGVALFGQYCAACHGPQGVIGIPNPDSDDGAVPSINPIDPTIMNSDPKKFAENLDLFIEHGSVPSGTSPMIAMPAFGDLKVLTSQQIADVIAYVISLNSGK